MFQRRSQRNYDAGLPMASNAQPSSMPSLYGNGKDGSGKGIQMEAPVARAWRNASGWTKGSYIGLVICLLVIYSGYKRIRYSNASIWLDCHARACYIDITPPGFQGTRRIKVGRSQVVRSQATKVDKFGRFVENDTGSIVYRSRKSKDYNSRGPDANGNFESYNLILSDGKATVGTDSNKDESSTEDNDDEETDLSELAEFVTIEDTSGHYVLSMRQYNFGQTRRRSKTMVNKIDAYIRRRRHKLLIKENAELSVIGIVLIVLGMFGLLVVLLLGEFWEDTRLGGVKRKKKRAIPPQVKSKRATPTHYTRKAY